MTYDEILQFAGRMTGIFPVGAQQTIYASEGDLESINKAFNFQEDIFKRTVRKFGKMEQIQRTIDGKVVDVSEWRQQEETTSTGDKIIKRTETSEWKYRSKKVTKKGRHSSLTRMLNKHASPKKVIDDRQHVEEDFVRNDIIRENNKEEEEKEEEEFNQTKYAKFIKWKKDNTIVGKFIKSLIYKNKYSIEELVKLAKNAGYKNPKQIIDQSFTNKKSSDYLISKLNGNKYCIDRCLKAEWERAFK